MFRNLLFQNKGELGRTSAGGKETDGGDDHEQKPKANAPKGNEALGSKGKRKFGDDDEEEEDENEMLNHKAHDAEIDENL